MKNTIHIQNDVFFYESTAELIKSESEDLAWSNTFVISKKGAEKYALTIHFLAKDDYYMGNTLMVEMVDEVSLDNPELIEKIIRFGLEKGWNPTENGMEIGEGMNILRAIGYNVNSIDAATQRNMHEYLIRNSEIKE